MAALDPETRHIIEEILSKAKLEDHRALVEWLAGGVVAAGLQLATREDLGASSLERYRSATAPPRGIVRIDPTVGQNALWDFIHEFGHTLSPIPAPDQEKDPVHTLGREEAAWEDGWDACVAQFPGLWAFREEHRARRDECLEGYTEAAGSR